MQTRKVRHQAKGGFCAAGRGTALLSTRARRPATGLSLTARASTSVFVAPRKFRPNALVLPYTGAKLQPRFDAQLVAWTIPVPRNVNAPSKRRPPAGPDGKTLLAQAKPIDDALIGRLRATAYARDLVLEKVDGAGSTEQSEKAVYVVNRTGDDDSRVVADVTLIHK